MRSRLQHISRLGILILLALLLANCKTMKKIGPSTGHTNERNETAVLNNVLKNELNYKTLSGKVSLEFRAGNKTTKTGSFVKMIKDSVIQISIRPFLGVEVFRVTLTPDSVFILDRMNKKYAAEESLFFQQQLHFNFFNIQALLTNSLFIPDKKAVTPPDFSAFSVDATPETYLIRTENQDQTMFNFAVNTSYRILSTLIVDQKQRTVQCSYSNFFTDKHKHTYPTQILFEVGTANNRFNIGLSYSKLAINNDLNINYSASARYQKTTIKEMLKTYMK